MAPPVVLRPRGGQVLAGIAVAVCAGGIVFIGVTDGLVGLARWGWPIAFLAWSAWLLYMRPGVRVTDGFVELDNIVRAHRVPWSAITDVESRYALTLVTADGRRVQAWAAPAPGARQALSVRREEVSRTPGEGDTRRPADAEGTPSGDAAGLVRRRLTEIHRANPGAPVGGSATVWHVPLIVATILLAAASILSLTLPHA